MSCNTEHYGSFEMSAVDPAKSMPVQSLRITPQPTVYELNYDAIKTIDDIKAILKAMRMGFSGDAAKDIEHLLGDEIKTYVFPATQQPKE